MKGRMKFFRVLAIALALVSCGERADKLTQLPAAEQAGRNGAQPEAIPVAVVAVERRELVRPVLATGTTEPAREADLGPQMTGRISAMLVEEGEVVKAGAALVRLDADEASLRVQQTAAGAAQTRAQYELARSEYERLSPLLEKGTVTPQQLQRLASQRDALKSAADAALVSQSDARRMQGNTTVRAPFSGIVSKVPMEVGEVFISGTKLAAFCAALLGAAVLWAFLKFTYVGTAIRAIARDREVMPLMGVDPRRIYQIALFHAERHTNASNFQLTLGGFVKATSTCRTTCGDGVVAV